MPREIEIRRKAEKELRAIPVADGQHITKAVMALRSGLSGDVKRLTNFTLEYRLRVGDWRVLLRLSRRKSSSTVSFTGAKLIGVDPMKTQIIAPAGKKAFAVIPYKDFLRLQEALEDYHALKVLRHAKADPSNQSGRPFAEAARELGLLKAHPRTDAVPPRRPARSRRP